MKDWAGKKITIIGAGTSGLAAARLCSRQGARVKVSENQAKDKISPGVLKEIEDLSLACEWGGHTAPFIEDNDLIVISPGVRSDASCVVWAKAKGVPVTGEVELASRFCPCRVIAVTGSNGKTTVSTLIAEFLRAAGHRVFLCGNVGFPFSSAVRDMTKTDMAVVEVSSFQLETIERFHPFIAVFLNFNENHLDRHRDMREYFTAKTRIFENQTADDFAVLNKDDERIQGLGETLKARVVFFSESQALKENGIGPKGADPNYLAASTVAGLVGVDEAVCRKTFQEFKGVEHRMERVRILNGVVFINDSKATTAQSGSWALKNVPGPVVLICGGRDKNIDFSVLREQVAQKVRKMIVIGEASKKLSRTFQDIVDVEESNSLSSAVERARACAVAGDYVLLSPLCASFDMFRNFEERGRVFKEYVCDLD